MTLRMGRRFTPGGVRLPPPVPTCLTCGHVGCCDSRLGHASAHAAASGHPIIRAIPRGNGFTYCYAHRAYL
jgi:Zn-finger in ubiquitin-hydrolases and other protein